MAPKTAPDPAQCRTGRSPAGTVAKYAAGPVRLLLVFDRRIVRDGVRALFTGDREVMIVGDSSGELDAVEAAVRRLRPDVVLIDQQLVEADGIAVAAGLVDRLPEGSPGIAILSGAERAGDLHRAARAGIRGYLLEQDDSVHVVSGVKAVAAGEAWLSSRAARRVLDHYRADPPAPVAFPRPDLESLTHRERGVVELIARGRSNAEIADELALGEATVKTHVSRILTKLRLRDRTQLAVFAHRNGLVREAGAERPV